MNICPECGRAFKKPNQTHTCLNRDPWELLEGRPDHLLLAFDSLLTELGTWPSSPEGSKHAVMFVSPSLDRWLIVRPMSTQLDLSFRLSREHPHPLVHKITSYGKNFTHHVRVAHEHELTPELFGLLRTAFPQSS